MNDPGAVVNNVVEPSMFPGGALSITLECLLDPEEHTVLFVVRAFDVGASKLIALWSSSPVGFDEYATAHGRALREVDRLLYEHTGPF